MDQDDLEALLVFTLRQEEAVGPWSIAVALVDDAELRRLHRDFMGIDEETDVMTFPAGDSSPAGGGGDIAISIDRAAAQGPEWGHSRAEEIMFLAVHGTLHLCGWDDAEPEARARMLERQRAVMAAFSGEAP